jgi:DNA-binding transcriptional ArsR family regulator
MLARKARRRGSLTTFTIVTGGRKDQLTDPPAPSRAMQNIEFVASALDILELLASNSQGLLAQEVSARLGVQLDVVKELLSTLARHGFVKLDRRSKHYIVGVKLVELAGK